MSKGAPGVRYAELDRETRETRVHVVIDLDGGTRQDIGTGIEFFDHMLELMAFHGHFDLGVHAEGDLLVDDHHTVEDVGIVIGKAIARALEDSEPIERYASNHTAMDDALVLVALDMSGRGRFHGDLPFTRDRLGQMSTENVAEFFRGLCQHAGITLHIRRLAGENDHHLCEAVFKGFGMALHAATRRSERRGTPSTKGKID
ncbi:MAG TPA: imidazoleglycerol-phosphate dehydratase HisB [Fimbriimonadaceae bacterium]|nr:imidazoleglycerol-phosphate dehydratase HisB [Fimbriimonadaceae bacterium]